MMRRGVEEVMLEVAATWWIQTSDGNVSDKGRGLNNYPLTLGRYSSCYLFLLLF